MQLRFWVLSFVFLLAGCSQPRKEVKQPEARRPDVDANDVARFLAGVPGRADGPFHALESTPAWQRHRVSFDAMWAKFEENRLPAMRAFQQKEIPAPSASGHVVLYPFGGPDTLTVTTLFPNRRTYVLIGLEPPGTLPTTDQVLHANLERQLPNMARTLDSLLRRSFFITASMDRELRGQITDGVLPVMLVQLARRGFVILSRQRITLSDDGEIQARTGVVKRNRGIGIEVRSPSGDIARIIYLAANLNNKGLEANEALRKFVARSSPAVAFFKSTSYMPHKPEFSMLREMILQHCSAIVQDDSGIPYRFVNQSQWNIHLYGSYTQPYGSFRYLVQKDLRKAYEQHSQPLGFRIGYGFGRVPSAMQIFTRKG
ncbi:MAG: hypothetical protein JNL62_01845 [Bryobacterales bacterium]|nr:hypothetical protein [Bryobacterales bacterium]